MKNNTAIFNAQEKKINFRFQEELFVVDLTDGDLEDSWSSITTSKGVVFDTNFWVADDYSQCNFSIYPVVAGLIVTGGEFSLTVTDQIGSFKDYFGEDVLSEEPTNSFTVKFIGEITVDDVSSEHEAREKVKLMEVDFNDTYVEATL